MFMCVLSLHQRALPGFTLLSGLVCVCMCMSILLGVSVFVCLAWSVFVCVCVCVLSFLVCARLSVWLIMCAYVSLNTAPTSAATFHVAVWLGMCV